MILMESIGNNLEQQNTLTTVNQGASVRFYLHSVFETFTVNATGQWILIFPKCEGVGSWAIKPRHIVTLYFTKRGQTYQNTKTYSFKNTKKETIPIVQS